jgi:non-specific serine/threonine protein kinase/serine/threonine-protein kinase
VRLDSPDHWRKILSLFDEAVKLSPGERAAFLDSACGGDANLRARVEELLASADRAGDFLEKPLVSQAGDFVRQAVDALPSASGSAEISGPSHSPTATVPPAGAAAEVIGPYRLLQKIGEGGMGEVWLAEQTEPVRRKVALKLIKAGMDSKQVIARFEAERQALALMDHPAIAKVFDAGETPRGLPYFAMEHVKGESITSYCDRHRLSTAERLVLLAQVCDGVQHAHQKGVIHRDLKPSNVLVEVVGEKPFPKIIDFGVAKATAQRLTEKTMFTELGVLIGTPEYMSPEQAEMTGLDIDTRTDVYALGVMLYELLTGALPFESKELRQAGYDEIRRRIREVDPPRPSTRVSSMGARATDAARNRRTEPRQLAGRLRGDLDWIVMKTLEKDRTRRYGSPSELAADLVRHLGHEPVLAGPPSALYRTKKFVRRHRFGVAAAALAVLGLAGFGVAMAVQARAIGRERDRAERVSEFLVNLFNVSDPSEARGNSVTAREVLDRGAEKIHKELADEPLIQGQMMDTMGNVYRNLGLWKEAEPLLREAVELRRRHLGEEAPETLNTLTDLSRLLEKMGRPREAEEIDRRTVKAWQRIQGEEGLDTLKAMARLAVDLEKQGNMAEAEQLNRKVLDLRRRHLPSDHPDVLWATHNLAAVLWQEGRNAEAEPLFHQAVEGMERVMGRDHPDSMWMKHNLAGLYYDQGRLAEAERTYQEVLETRRQVLGPENPGTLATLSNLANVYYDLGRKEEAVEIHRQAMEISPRVRGADHPNNFSAMFNVASIDIDLKRYDEAETLLNKALEGFRRVRGPDHPDTYYCLVALGALDIKLKRYAKAEKLIVQGHDGLSRTQGPGSSYALDARYSLAALDAVRGRKAEALSGLTSLLNEGFHKVTQMEQDEDFASLRDDPEFKRILAAARSNAEPTTAEPASTPPH